MNAASFPAWPRLCKESRPVGGAAWSGRWFCVALLSLGCLTAREEHPQSAEQAPDTMEARVMACAPCHGAKGQGTENDYFPRLAGKPRGICNQLQIFTWAAHYPPMNYLLAYLHDDYLRRWPGTSRRSAFVRAGGPAVRKS